MSVKKRQSKDPKDVRTNLIYIVTLVLGCGLVVIMQGKWVAKHSDIYLAKPSDKFQNGPNGSILVQCSHCNFHGRILVDEREVMCPICFGVGGHYVKRKDTGELYCMLCDGMGRILDGVGVRSQSCPVCEGRGVKRVAYGRAFCPNCEGLGDEFDQETGKLGECALCSGSGRIFQEVSFCSTCQGSREQLDPVTREPIPCPNCMGNTKVLETLLEEP